MKFDILVLMTSFNRREKTLRALKQLSSIENIDLKVVLVDDNSSDGTVECIAKYFPEVCLIIGSGSLFWAKGMKLAEESALNFGFDSKYILLLNDDVFLFPEQLLEMYYYAEENSCSMIGTVKDSKTGELSYGGLKKSGLHPLNFKLGAENSKIWTPDVFHANVALIRYTDYRKVGGIDDGFAHAYADFDLAIRLKKSNAKVFVFNKVVGLCDSNPLILRGNLFERFALLSSEKGRPLRSQFRFLKRHTNSLILSVIFTISPYAKAVIGKK
jgi:GT2 family glycosyltransferase